MSVEILDVPREFPVRDVARTLCDRHIHRIFVSGEDGPVGVISTMDVLKSIAGVAQTETRS